MRTVSLKLTSNFRLVGAVFVYSSLVALCYVDVLCYGTFKLAQVIQTTIVTLPVYNRHQEFTVLTPSFFFPFLDPACIGGRPLFVRVDHAPGHYKRPAFIGIQATIRGFTVYTVRNVL